MKKILFFLLAIGFQPFSLWAQCAPVNARIWVSGDDTTQVWVGGSYLGEKGYCNLATGGNPATLFFPVPLEKLPGPQVCLALETLNVNPVMVFSSWELEVDCAGGRPYVFTNEGLSKAGVSLYWDPTGGSSCGVGTSPPVDSRGNVWTDLEYNPASNPFTFTGSFVTASTWTCARLKEASTGLVIPYVSYDGNAAGSGPTTSCGILYWRQVVQLPAWVHTATPTAILTATFTFTPTPTPRPLLTPTFTYSPLPSFTPTFTPRPRRTPTSHIISRPAPPTPTPRRVRIRPTPTLLPFRPTATWTPLRLAPWTPTPPPLRPRPTPLPAWLPPPVKDQTIVFQTPPVEIYITFADGVGRYQLQVVDGQGRPLEVVYDRKIVGEKDDWVTWDGKDGWGRDVAPGQYYVIFYKDGKPLRSISVYRSGIPTNR